MEYIKLGAICDVINGYAFKSEKYSTSGVRIIRITNVQKGYVEDASPVYYPLNTINELKKYILYSGDLLISLTGNVGRVAILDKKYLPAFLNQRVACIRPKSDKILKEYLFYMLNTNLFEVKSINSSKGIAQKNISTEWLKNYVVPLPSIEIQQHLISILKKLEKAVRNKKHELRALDKLVKARFVEMFGDPVLNSKKYPEKALENYINFITSGSRGWAKYLTPKGKAWFLTIKNVKNSHIVINNIQSVEPPDSKEAQRTKVKEGDLLISITADLGRTGVVSSDIASHGTYINQHLTCIRLNTEFINPVYASYFLETVAGKRQFNSKNQNGVKAGLNFDAIKSLKIIIPPIKRQNSFVSFVEQVDKSKVAVQKSLDETQKLYDSLMQEYFG